MADALGCHQARIRKQSCIYNLFYLSLSQYTLSTQHYPHWYLNTSIRVMLWSWTAICECTPGVTGLPLAPCSVHRWEHRLHWRTSGPHATYMESDSQKCAWAPCRRSFCRAWAMLLLSFLLKRSNTAPCNVPSPCMSTTVLKGGDIRRLWRVAEETFSRCHLHIYHLGRAGLPVQPEWTAVTISCCQQQ